VRKKERGKISRVEDDINSLAFSDSDTVDVSREAV
jgi:hypothetical protein